MFYSRVTTQIRGTLNSGTGKTYRLQFFSSPSGNTNGYGEGRVFLGQTNLTWARRARPTSLVLLPVSVPAGWVVTATATDPANNTSEFFGVGAGLDCSLLADQQREPDQLADFPFPGRTTAEVMFYSRRSASTRRAQWTTVTNAPLLTNGFFVLTLSATNGNTF